MEPEQLSQCKNITPKKRRICTGDLKDRIEIQSREIKPKTFSDPDYQEDFVTIKPVWASVQTTRGFQSFNDVGTVENNITHKIYIRFSTELTITSENWIIFKNERYDIIDDENLDERDEFLLLYCEKKGSDTVPANEA